MADPTPQTTGWRPIETAPRDGTNVLVWWPYRKGDDYNYEIAGITLGWWKTNRRTGESYFTWVGEDDDYDLKTRPPSHWMLLPEPPK